MPIDLATIDLDDLNAGSIPIMAYYRAQPAPHPRPGITFMQGNLPWGCFGPTREGGYLAIADWRMFLAIVWIVYLPGRLTGWTYNPFDP